MKCVRIVLARGQTADQPMATWRRASTTLSDVKAEADRLAADATAAGFAVTRVKIEADPHNADVPTTDADVVGHPPANYFEHHVKLRRDKAAGWESLVAACERHGAHLSRNSFKDGGDFEERFVTLRAYGAGRSSAVGHLNRLLDELRSLGETAIEFESEYCVYDTNLLLDAGWLAADPPRSP